MKYRKRPLIIEAIQYDGSLESLEEMKELWQSYGFKQAIKSSGSDFEITTLEGSFEVSPSDWIIKGIKNEFYSCKNEIFLESYEVAE
jgi:hypothetical protein